MTEKFLAKFVAPYLLSSVGRLVTILSYTALIAFSINSIYNMRIFWSLDLYFTEEAPSHEYFIARDNLIKPGIKPRTQIKMTNNLDFSTEDA